MYRFFVNIKNLQYIASSKSSFIGGGNNLETSSATFKA